MLDNLDVLCFANDWSADPTSKHHIMRRLAETNRVLWIEAAGMRRPNLGNTSDIRRLVRKARGMFRRSRQALPRLHVYAPPALPLPGSSIANALNAGLYRATLKREMSRTGITRPPLMWVFAPHVAPLIRRIPRQFLIYHCVDRWSAFQDYNASVMAQSGAELCRVADLVLASAEDLAERCRRYTANVHYVPHGVDYAHFARALQHGPIPEDLRSVPEPRVGFFGLIHEWVDLGLIGRLADALPCSFVLLGTSSRDLSELTQRPNVFHLGRKPYSQLPDYCRGFAAAIVPFEKTELTRSVNPIKLREYAAAGLPVVSTDLPEVRRSGDIAICASDTESWIAAVREAVSSGCAIEYRRRQSMRVAHEDWAGVCERISKLVVNARRPRVPSTRG